MMSRQHEWWLYALGALLVLGVTAGVWALARRPAATHTVPVAPGAAPQAAAAQDEGGLAPPRPR